MKIKKLHPDATLPAKPKKGDAGHDLFSLGDVLLYPGEIKAIPTGIAMEIPTGFVGIIKPRSGLALNGIDVLAGVIDSSYRGEIKVVLCNLSQDTALALSGNVKIAQMLFMNYFVMDMDEVDELSNTERQANGFGSTGV
jgi:dUTP pyrophosphatase